MSNLKIYARVTSVLIGLVLGLSATSAFALENAYRYQSNSNTGVRVSIVTSNPTLRNNSSGKWSYMRPFVQRVISGNVYYAEIGHYKDDSGQRVFWTYRTTSGSINSGFVSGAVPGVGLSYNYQVQRTSTNVWSLYFNSLSSANVTANIGFDAADTWASGGETPNTSQGMGSSGNNNVSYRNSSSGSWVGASPNTNNITNSIYSISNGSNSTSWTVSGNN